VEKTGRTVMEHLLIPIELSLDAQTLQITVLHSIIQDLLNSLLKLNHRTEKTLSKLGNITMLTSSSELIRMRMVKLLWKNS
jgi:hypothetical protein